MKFGTLLLKQIVAARDFLEMRQPARKAKRKPGEKRIKKQPYKPGSIGISMVSASIKKDYGAILSRRERRKNKPFVAYYNR